MARPLRIEYVGALYHVTSRGDRREAIFADDADRLRFLAVLADVVADYNWICHAYCLMDNHYHLLIETPDANLSKGMRQLNGVFTQACNRRHGRVGHVFQGRFKAILVDANAYLLELARYIVLNPVRAGAVRKPGRWPWSSYQAMIGEVDAPVWLNVDGLLSAFAVRRSTAIMRYVRFVQDGIKAEPIWRHLNAQVYLGDDDFVARSLRHVDRLKDRNIPKAQRRQPPPSLASITREHKDRDAAIIAAYATGAYSYADIAQHFGLHFTHVGRIVRQAKDSSG